MIEKQEQVNINFKGIPLESWGKELTMVGVVYRHDEGHKLAVILPGEKKEATPFALTHPTREEWNEMMIQLDTQPVEVMTPEGKVVLRKGQRNVDQKIAWKVYKRDKYRCRYCNVNSVPLTVDHLVLWEEGGPTTMANLLTACGKCNRTRGNTQYAEWVNSKAYLAKANKYLSEAEILANEQIVATLESIPRLNHIKSR